MLKQSGSSAVSSSAAARPSPALAIGTGLAKRFFRVRGAAQPDASGAGLARPPRWRQSRRGRRARAQVAAAPDLVRSRAEREHVRALR